MVAATDGGTYIDVVVLASSDFGDVICQKKVVPANWHRFMEVPMFIHFQSERILC